jgi:hypothetical protein
MALPTYRNDHQRTFQSPAGDDSGPMRAVINQNGQVLGATAHPRGSVLGANGQTGEIGS